MDQCSLLQMPAPVVVKGRAEMPRVVQGLDPIWMHDSGQIKCEEVNNPHYKQLQVNLVEVVKRISGWWDGGADQIPNPTN